MSTITGWQAVLKALKAEKIKYIFGMPGSAEDLYDALYDEPDLQPILVRHEAAGGFMAMAYALMTGEPAVCFATQGPGAANLTPALLEAQATCAPVIAFCPAADGRLEGKGAFQETDQLSMMKPLTKWAVRVPHAEKIPWAVRRAISLATNGQPGPVYIELPLEVGRGAAEVPEYIPAHRYIRPAADLARIIAAAYLLSEAKRPVLVAGGGARRSAAHDEVQSLVEHLGMPVMTTPSGRGIIPEDHPLAIGQVGLYRTRLGMQAFEQADLVITVGSRNEEFQTGSWKIFPPDAKLVQIDIESFELGRNWIPDIPILGDAKLVLGELLMAVQTQTGARPEWASRRAEIARAKQLYEAEIAVECQTDDTPIKTRRVVYELNQVFGKNTILVNENGSQDLWSYYSPYYKVLDRDGVVAPGEQTCMGGGVMGAVGAKLARPEMNVVCLTGDGAFQMYNQDIPTAVQHNAPVTWIILNTNSLGWTKYSQQLLGERFIAVDFEIQPDFVAMAHAYQCYGERVIDPREIHPALERALQANHSGKPAILEVIVDPDDHPEGFMEFKHLKSEKRKKYL